MKKLNNKLKLYATVAMSTVVLLSACNKGLEELDPINTSVPQNPIVGSVAQVIASNPNDSLFYKLLVRSTLLPLLNDTNKRFTIFAVDNAGMKIFVNAATGGAVPLNAPDATFVGFINNSLPVASAVGIIQYNTIGQQYLSGSWANAIPNLPLPSQIQLDPINTPFLRMTICPSINNGINYVNNIPVFNPAIQASASNGVVHHSYTIAAPPTKLLKDLISTDTALVFFRAAVARGDSGSVGTSKLDSLLGFGVLNMTVLAPNNAAMRTAIDSLIYPNVYSQVYAQVYPVVYQNVYNAAIALMLTPAQATAFATANSPAIAATNSLPIAHSNSTALASSPTTFSLLPVSAVKGLLAYHFLASNSSGSIKPDIRFFSVNSPTTPKFIKTLVNGSLAAHPGINAVATFAGPTPTSVKLTGFGILKEGWGSTIPVNPAPYTGAAANVIAADRHGVNGVYHIIDRVLLPQ